MEDAANVQPYLLSIGEMAEIIAGPSKAPDFFTPKILSALPQLIEEINSASAEMGRKGRKR